MNRFSRGLLGGAMLWLGVEGCSDDPDPCESARQKLDSCKEEIRKVVAAQGYAPFPVTFTEECTGDLRCLAECARNATCTELAYGIDPTLDPNSPAPPSSAFAPCARRCLARDSDTLEARRGGAAHPG